MASPPNPVSDAQVGLLRDTVVALVRRDGADLSARQLGVFLTCYLNDGGHTVRGLAAELNVSKPAITRALDVWVNWISPAVRSIRWIAAACWCSARRKDPLSCVICGTS